MKMRLMLAVLMMTGMTQAKAGSLEDAKVQSGLRFQEGAPRAGRAGGDGVDASEYGAKAGLSLKGAAKAGPKDAPEVPAPQPYKARWPGCGGVFRNLNRCMNSMAKDDDIAGPSPAIMTIEACAAFGAVAGGVVASPGLVSTPFGIVAGASLGASVGSGIAAAMSIAVCVPSSFDPEPEERLKAMEKKPQASSRGLRMIL